MLKFCKIFKFSTSANIKKLKVLFGDFKDLLFKWSLILLASIQGVNYISALYLSGQGLEFLLLRNLSFLAKIPN